MSRKRTRAPKLWTNSFLWIAGLLVVVAIVGLVRGQEAIRDPGQVREDGLTWMYLGGAVLMAVNGLLTHRIAVQQFQEQQASEE